MTAPRAILALGGNVGDVARTMADALNTLCDRDDLRIVSVSRLFSTPPWGKTDQPDFINACALVETELSPLALLDLCLSTERDHGRERGERWGPRTLDLDLIDYDGRRIEEDRLQLPHPRALERAFVLVPLLDIDPDLSLAGIRISDRAAGLAGDGIRPVSDNGDWWVR